MIKSISTEIVRLAGSKAPGQPRALGIKGIPRRRAVVLVAVAAVSIVGCLPGRAAERQVLHDPRPAALPRLKSAGRLPGAQRLNLAIGLPLRNQEALASLLQELYDPASPSFRQYLTPEQFTVRFGPTQQDYQAVIDFAETNGLTVIAEHPNRVVLDVAGTVTDIERAFHLTLRVYHHPKETRDFYAPDVTPSLALAVPVLDISGLDNYTLPHPNLKARDLRPPAGALPQGGSGPGGTYRGNDFRAAYLPGTLLTGLGQSVGLLQFDGFYASDIASYASQTGLPNVPLVVVPVDGGVGTPGTGNAEVALDIEMVMSMAPGVSKIIVYEAPNPSPWVDLLSRMANDNLAKQLSCSWGGGSPNATAEQIFQQMAAQGQSFFNASGDSDAFTAAIAFPADSTNIVQVGGTTLTTTGPGGAYVSETVWNWNTGTGSSGGISTYYPLPPYQQGLDMTANQGTTTKRNIPDVALTADNVYVVYNNGNLGNFGGTSCAAPLWAGLTALINQQATGAGRPTVGFLNPAIYTLGKGTDYASTFHDTTTGNNTSSASPTRFYATAGYDLCTGWGTPNGISLINALAGPPTIKVVTNGVTLTSESCLNGSVDPGETVTMNFDLLNTGGLSTTNLVARLQAGGGVTLPSGPQDYGILSSSAARSLPFTFTASGACGGTITATLQLQDGATDLGHVAFSIPLGQWVAVTRFAQNFDSVSTPSLPAGWTSAASGGQSPWVTATAIKDTAPYAAFSAESAAIGVNELVSPSIPIGSAAAQLSFRHSYNLQIRSSMTGYDGGVLEIAIGAGSFADILTAGGSFVSGGYTRTISSARSNPLAGRSAWSGTSGGFITSVILLPAAAAGQNVRFKWRCGTDSSTGGSGWYVDTVSITESSYVCCAPSADLSVKQTPSPNPALVGQTLSYLLTVANLGPTTAVGVTLNDVLPAGVAFVSASPGCTNYDGNVACNLGTLAMGAITNIVVTVEPSGEGVLTNSVAVTATSPDSQAANNAATSLVTVNARPAILTPFASRAAVAGTDVNFAVNASGTEPLSYQWLFGGTILAGANNNTLLLTNLQPEQTGIYAVAVANPAGSATNAVVSLTVLEPPAITMQPSNQTVAAGACVSFQVTASGSAPLSYQWLLAGTNLTDATADTLLLTKVQTAQAGNYAVLVTNMAGSVTSSVATLKILVPPTIAGISATGTGVSLSLPSIQGLTYTLECKDSLKDPVWTALPPTLAGTGEVLWLADTNALPPHRFYRVRCE